MSRSYRYSPFAPVCGVSAGNMKAWKRQQSAAYRANEKRVLHSLQDTDDEVLPVIKGDLWCSPSDGKFMFDPEESPELTRV